MTSYRERLTPSPGLFIALLLIIPASLMVFLPINPLVGAIVAVVLYLGCSLGLIVTAPVIEVTPEYLAAGRARLPLTIAGEPESFTGDAAVEQRGLKLDARAWLVIRGWVSPVVRIPVDDPADPTPYWLVSTRRPDALIAAIREAKKLPN